jgi:hypothetical protein
MLSKRRNRGDFGSNGPLMIYPLGTPSLQPVYTFEHWVLHTSVALPAFLDVRAL